MWAVVDPDGIVGETFYGDKEEAEDLAEKLNWAFRLGKDKKRAGLNWY